LIKIVEKKKYLLLNSNKPNDSMKKLFSLLLVTIAISYYGCKTEKQNVDLLIINAHIYTVNNGFDIAEAMAISDGKIIDIGNTERLRKKYSATKTIDAKGKYLYPGFNDAHCHLYGYGITKLRYANLSGTKSWDEIIDSILEFSKDNKSDWILGRGWDQNDWENSEFPTNEKLNELFPNKAVLLTRIDGHAVIVNQKAIELSGFDENTVIEGGQILKKNGKITGVMLDNAADYFKNLVTKPNVNEIKKAIDIASNDCIAVGLTSLTDAGLPNNILKILESQDTTTPKIRINAMISPSRDNFRDYLEKKGVETKYLRIKSIKLYADGALGSRGACLLQPYSDDINNHGLIISNTEYIDSICKIALLHNFQVNTHAIGDSGVRMVLKAYAKNLDPNNDRRWRVEHAQTVNPSDFHYFKDFKIIPAINTTHATSDMYWAENRLGKERIKTAYAYRELLNQNGWVTNGSDFPIEGINPLLGFYAGVARQDIEGFPEGGFQIENALSREQALRAMTIWAAKGAFMEDEIGSLEIGKRADFVILKEDLMSCNLEIIPKIKVESTWINGVEVYSI
jgi:predicted amidohydrolase YtcJ